MVMNLGGSYDDRFHNVALYGSAVYKPDGVTFGIWCFQNGEFTLHSDGGYMNWAFRGWFDRQDKHVKFFNNQAVVVYEHAHYSGAFTVLPRGRYRLPSFNDRVSSLTVPSGFKATLFEHDKLQGRFKVYTSSSPATTDFNDVTSSVIVE